MPLLVPCVITRRSLLGLDSALFQSFGRFFAMAAVWTRPILAGANAGEKSRQGRINWCLAVILCALLSAGFPALASGSATTTTLAVVSAGKDVTTVTAGSVVALVATVKAGTAAVTLGQVNFCDASATYCTDIHLLGTAQPTKAGIAIYKLRPGIGSHNYKAVFLGTASDAKSASSAAALTVTGKYPTITTIAQSGSWDSFSLTATVTAPKGLASPTGTVSFLDTSNGNKVLASAGFPEGITGMNWVTSQTPSTGGSPRSVTIGDFNGDGIADLAIANYDGGVTVLLGKGDGTFTAAASPATGIWPVSLASADFNGDGKLDLAVPNLGSDTVTILLGKGDGTFTAAASAGTGSGPCAIAVGDFNGDGIPDLVVANAGSNSGPSPVTVLLGKGDGTFIAAASPAAGVGPVSVAVGDFNGDGKMDLAVANEFSDSVTVLLGKGDGTFTGAASPVTGKYPKFVVVGDFNGDGKMDLAVSNQGDDNLTILLGKGDGTFTAAASPLVGSEPQSIGIGDFNGDGKLDLAVANAGDSTLTILLGNGDGTFTAAVNPVPVDNQFAAVADFNGDGAPDLAVTGPDADTATILLTQFTETATVNGIAPTGQAPHFVEASYSGDSIHGSSISATTLLEAPAATPAITPKAGSYTSAQTVKITDATSGAVIYYTTDGSIPPSSSTSKRYTGSIAVTTNETIHAVATATNYTQSGVAVATYTIELPAAAQPKLSLGGGVYAGPETVSITDATSGAKIYYTTNGSSPTTASALYSGSIGVSSSETLVAAAIAPGYSMSTPAVAEYIVTSSSVPFIYTVAGDGMSGYGGDGGPATGANISLPSKAIQDTAGNLYIADAGNNRVRKVTAGTGIITTFAGNGTSGYSGDKHAAIGAELNYPTGLALDSSGNLYISDSGNNVIRKVTAATGIIATFAGNGTPGYGGDGKAATSAELDYPRGISFDGQGNLYIADSYNNVIRMVAQNTGIISTVAGTGNWGYSGDGGPAIDASFVNPMGVAAFGFGDLWIADTYNNVVRKVTASTRLIATVAGNGYGAYGHNEYFGGGYSGDGGPATSAELYFPQDVAVVGEDILYIADSNNNAIRKVNEGDGIISTVAGNGSLCTALQYGYALSGDGDPAASEGLCTISYGGVAAGTYGNLLVADSQDNRIREVAIPINNLPTVTATAPVFSVLGGTYPKPQSLTITDSTPGASIYVTLDGRIPNGSQQLGYFRPIAVTGNVTIKAIAIAPGYLPSAVVTEAYTITPPLSSAMTTFAGDGVYGFAGEGGPAAAAQIGNPQGVAFDGSGNFYFTDSGNNLVWMVAAQTGVISVVAGNGTGGYSGDGGPATSAELNYPNGIASDAAGNLYIADSNNNALRRVDALTGIVTTIAGDGKLQYPYGVALDQADNVYVSDNNNNVIRKIASTTGIISTFAGNGNSTYSGDGGPAISAGIPFPYGITFDGSGSLYIADGSGRTRKVAAGTGIITTVAGNGYPGYSGDGGPATSAEALAYYLAFDAAGNLYLATNWPAVRKVSATTGIITTVAGTGYSGYSGDGGSARVADMNYPEGIAFDGSGNLYIADVLNSRIRKVEFFTPTVTVTPSASSINTVQSLTVKVLVSDGSGKATPTGNVTLVGGGFTSAATVLSNGSATIGIPAGSLALGVDTLTVTFTPTGTTNYTSATGSAAVTVKPDTPIVTLSATTLPFGSQEVGTAGASQSVMLTNTGGAALSITSIIVSGADASSFLFVNNCGTSLAAGASCAIHGHFAPTAAGAMTAAISIIDNASGSPQTVKLSGTGYVPPAVSLSATSLSFGTERVGSATTSKSVTLTNTGGAALSITSIAVTGAGASSFAFSDSCGTSLAAGAACTIHGHFAPTTVGAIAAAITIADNADGSPQSIALSGTGEGAIASLSATSLSFGAQAVGTASASQSVTLTNTGNEALSITGISVTGSDAASFAFSNTCGASVAAGTKCSIHGHFAPAKAGTSTAAITIADDAVNSPQSIHLSGTGQ